MLTLRAFRQCHVLKIHLRVSLGGRLSRPLNLKGLFFEKCSFWLKTSYNRVTRGIYWKTCCFKKTSQHHCGFIHQSTFLKWYIHLLWYIEHHRWLETWRVALWADVWLTDDRDRQKIWTILPTQLLNSDWITALSFAFYPPHVVAGVTRGGDYP